MTNSKQDFKSEIEYWDKELSLKGAYPKAIINRSTPSLMYKEYPPVFEKYRQLFSHKIKVLDIGSGPMSMLAHASQNNLIDLECSDPLADEYYILLNKYGFKINYPIHSCPGETLTERFQEGSFDIIWIHNALDHSENPKVVFEQAVRLLKKSGYLLILGWSKEATAEGFLGLHQNDLFLENDHLMLSNRDTIKERIDDIPSISVVEFSTENTSREWLQIIYKKNQ